MAELIPAAAGFTFGALVMLAVLRRPMRRCADCGGTLQNLCTDRQACRDRKEQAALQRTG